jgi:hypothetical protein
MTTARMTGAPTPTGGRLVVWTPSGGHPVSRGSLPLPIPDHLTPHPREGLT